MEAIDALAERIARGDAFTDADARLVLDSHDLIAIGVLADDVRRRLHGARTTFVRVFELHVAAVPASLPPHVSAGELRLTGRPASLAAAAAAVTAASALAAEVPLTGFALSELQALGAAGQRSLEDVCAELREAGMDALAEVAIDAPGMTADAVLEARSAGLIVARATVHGHAAGFDIFGAMRRLQDVVGGFQAFAPLPRTMSVTEPSTGYDDARMVALARLVLSNVSSIQVDWPLYGPKLAQVALTMGADDVDGVAAQETGVLGARRSAIEEIRGNIRAASQEPVERNGRFEVMGA